LAKLNLENFETSKYMLNNLAKWASMGFDAFRIDHVLGIPDQFLIQLNRTVKAINPDFVLIGEAWGEGMRSKFLKTLRFTGRYKVWDHGFHQNDLQKHYEGILDGVLDFGWRNLLLDNITDLSYDPEGLQEKLTKYDDQFDNNFFLTRFLDNHDTSRIMHLCADSEELFKKAIKLLFRQNRPIVLYYGTEAGLNHDCAVDVNHPYSDLNARGLIDWNLDKQKFSDLIRELVKERSKLKY
jgi:glycosidase